MSLLCCSELDFGLQGRNLQPLMLMGPNQASETRACSAFASPALSFSKPSAGLHRKPVVTEVLPCA